MLVYLWLFGISLGAATILPFGSEPAFIVVVQAAKSLGLPLLVATFGNVAGSAINFWMGRKAGHYVLSHSKRAARVASSTKLLHRWGPLILVLAWVPIIGDVLVAVAGALRMPALPSLAWITIGKAGRYAVLGWLVLGL